MTKPKSVQKKETPKKKKSTRKSGKTGPPVGNQFWKMRSSHGRKPIFIEAEDLWNACVEYFEWVAANPLEEEKVFHTAGIITRASVSKMRAMTISGLCIFLDISQVTWRLYKERDDDFLAVITQTEEIIRTQKFEGAAAELLNPNIIARDLGLADKKEHSGPDGSAIPITGISFEFVDVPTKKKKKG